MHQKAKWSLSCLLALLSMLAGSVLPGRADESEKEPVPQVAHIRLARILPEESAAAGLFGARTTTLRTFLDRFNKASKDDRIKGVVLELDVSLLPLTHAQELRAAITRLQRVGKPVVAVLPAMATTNTYVAVAGCDRIVMPPDGWLLLTGVRFEVWFYRDLLDWLGIKARFLQAGAYKGAAEPYMRSAMSPEYRAQLERVADDLFRQICTAVAGRLNCSLDQAAKLVDKGGFLAKEALELGLVDELGYADRLGQTAARALGLPKVSLVKDYGVQKRRMPSGFAGVMQMMQSLFGGAPKRSLPSDRPRIALIYATGAIVEGKSTQSILLGKLMGDETIVQAIRKAEADDQVRAIVLRVDSPGGSATASEHIYQTLRQCKKPVIVSMGSVAASGGYYISLGGDVILAEPATLTGSIGVVGGKLAVRPALAKIGIRPDVVQRGRNADFLSVIEPLDEDGEKILRTLITSTYDQFLDRVSKSRGIDRERLEKLAEGRIWTGSQAVENGLVDRIGTLHEALELARQKGGIKPDEPYDLVVLPEPKNFFEMLMELTEAGGATPRLSGLVAAELPESLRPLLTDIQTLRRVFESRNPGVWLVMPHLIRY